VKYQAPYGESDPNAPYINGDPSIGREGSIPPAESIEHPQREIVNIINKSTFAPNASDLFQLTKAIRSQRVNFADDTGSVNTLSVAFDPPLTQYTVGLIIRVRVKNTNTGPVNIDAGAGRVYARRMNNAALEAGDIVANGIAALVFDGTGFQMLNFLGTGAGGPGTTNNYFVNLPYCVDTSVTPNVITAPFSPAITALTAGMAMLVKVKNNNNGPTVINVNALSPKPVKANTGGDLLPCDVIVDGIFLFIFDGTNMIIIPNPTIIVNAQFNIPSTQFNTPQLCINALGRKSIIGSSVVVIQLASGVYGPILIDHPDASHFSLRGTMLAAAPTYSNFQCTGSSAGARDADAVANLSMLRSRYGSEIRVPPSPASGYGVASQSSEAPGVSDLLITGNFYSDPNNRSVGVNANATSFMCNVSAQNVACWGCFVGFSSSATIVAISCWNSACWRGFHALSGGEMHVSGGGSFGCAESGVIAETNASQVLASVVARGNGNYGFMCGMGSYMAMLTCDAVVPNGVVDCLATHGSTLFAQSSAISSFSPTPNTEGNYNSMCIVG
jgi:hypothetical protein